LTTPVNSWVDGVGLTLEVAPHPAIVSSVPFRDALVLKPSGCTSVTGADSFARAMSLLADWRTSVTFRTSPGDVFTSPVFSVALVG